MNKALVVVVSASVLLFAGCGGNESVSAAGAVAAAGSASGGGAPVSVGTVAAQRRDFPVQLEATGTVTALTSVDVKPQVSSTIAQVHFREGQYVKAGQLLFSLDARTDETNVLKAQAQLQKDLASLADAQRQLARSKELLAQNFVSQTAVDTNQTLVDSQKAMAEADRAALKGAQVGLSYDRIVAPQAGRAGAVNVFPGTLVQPSSPPLVTITQLDPIAVSFNLPQRDLSDALAALRAGGGRVTAVVPDSRTERLGKLAFVDNTVDANSGTVKVKAVFDNKDEALWPGAFVAVKLAVRTLKDAIVVPQASIVQGVSGDIVFVVDESRKAAARPVKVLYGAGTDAVVSGIHAGEHVIVEGRQNMRPGTPVIEPALAPSSGAASTPHSGRGASASLADLGASRSAATTLAAGR